MGHKASGLVVHKPARCDLHHDDGDAFSCGLEHLKQAPTATQPGALSTHTRNTPDACVGSALRACVRIVRSLQRRVRTTQHALGGQQDNGVALAHTLCDEVAQVQQS
eukprot:3551031-Prymnesium_polylepis.1